MGVSHVTVRYRRFRSRASDGPDRFTLTLVVRLRENANAGEHILLQELLFVIRQIQLYGKNGSSSMRVSDIDDKAMD